MDIGGEPYWDGGYSSNPSLWPFIQDKATRDILLVRLFPATRPDIPKQPAKILNRINEITLDNALVQELRAIDFINRLVAEKDYFGHDYEAFRLHRIDPHPSVIDQPDVRWVDDGWTNFCKLRDAGRAAADVWLGENYGNVGARGTFDVNAEFARAR